MKSLNICKFNLSAIKNTASLFLCFFLLACSSTEKIGNNPFYENGYAQGFVHENFTHSQFSPINKNTIKKPLLSDHHLMMSLLNRPMTADQAMMLSFAQERAQYNDTYLVNAVEIKGEKKAYDSNIRAENIYTKLISQDINAISISAPQ